jgi:hypothetical protein
VTEVKTADRVSVGEAVRQTGVPGDRIFRAIFDGEISTWLNERGIDRVLVEEVRTLRDRAS